MVSDRTDGQLRGDGFSFAVALVLAAAVYWALGYAGLRYGAVVNLYVSPVWPSAGFALALVLVYGYRFWPAIFIGALAVNLEVGASWPVSGGIAAANTLSALLAVVLLRQYADFQIQLTRLRDAVNLVLVGAVLARAISSTLTVGALWLGGMVPEGEFGALWLNRWIGGAVGVLVVTPFFLAFVEPVGRSRGAKWYAEALILLVALVAVGALVFTPVMLASSHRYPLAFAALPFVIWAAVRFESRGASIASLLVAAISVMGTLNGHGPFVTTPRDEGMLLLAIYNGVVAATGLVVAGAIAELTRERAMRASLELLQQAFDLIPVGVWITDSRGRTTVSNPAGRRIWGGERQLGPKEVGDYKGWRLPGRTPIEAHDWALARAVEKGETRIGEEIEIEGFDGERRAIRNSAMPLRDGESRVIGAIAVNEDITELMRREQHLRELAAIVEQTDDIVVVTDRSGVIEYVNPSFERSTGYSRDEAIGRMPAILKSGAHDKAFYKELWGAILSGTVFRTVVCNRKKDGELYYEGKTISPIRDSYGEITRFVSTGKDITERIRAEERTKRLARARGVMAECNRVLVHATSETKMLEDMCRIAVELGGYRMAWIGYAEHDEGRSVRLVAQAGIEHGHVEAAGVSWADTGRGRGPTGTAIRTGKASGIGNLLADPRFAPWRERAAQYGFKSMLALPLSNGTDCIGAFNIYAVEPDAFDEEETLLLQELADDIAFGIAALRTRAQRERGEKLLQTLVEGTATATGAEFMRSMVKSLAGALQVRYAFVGQLVASGRRIATVTVWGGDGFGENFEYDLEGTPCREVVGRSMRQFPERVQQRFPEDLLLAQMGIEAYSGVPLFDSAGQPTGLLVVMDDKPMVRTAELESVLAIFAARAGAELERLSAEQALRESEELFRELAGNIPQLYWVRDAKTDDLQYASPAWERMVGRPPRLGESTRVIMDLVHPDDRARMLNARAKAKQGGIDEECRVVYADGSIRWVHLCTFPIRNSGGEVYRVAGVAEDITEHKDAEERLLKLAHYDSLTNLPNRALFFESLKRSLEQAQQNRWTFGVLFIDLDRFKVVNDTLGHATGDALLQQVASRLVECVRIRDVVGRLGGDEFALILPVLDSPDDAGAVAAKVLQVFAEPFNLAGYEAFVTASIGITVYPGDASEPDVLLRYADTAMYRAKAEGRNTYRYYTAEMNARALEKLELESALRRALERREFVLHFQPKLNLNSGVVSGVEALLRWQRPEVGLVSPADFIPLLEETGFIVPVGEWVIHAACQQINAWEQGGLSPVPIAINLSGRQFHQKNLASVITQLVREHGVAPQLLELEITESSVMANPEAAVCILEELQAAGIRISVDDFGTGYSSLAYLKRFPIDAVKIDRSFVRDIVENEDDAAITLAVIAMAHAMGLKVVAEGVETKEQLQFLRSNECDEIQGYFFSRPLGAADVTAFLRECGNPGTDHGFPAVPGR